VEVERRDRDVDRTSAADDVATERLLGESRWPPVVALLVFFVLNVALRVWLPSEGFLHVPWLLPSIEAGLVVVLGTSDPSGAEERRRLRHIALALVGLLALAALWATGLLVSDRTGRPAEPRPLPGVDRAAVLSLLAVAAVDLAAPGGRVAGIVAAFAACAILLRLSRWHGLRTLDQPILWVLHLAYLFIPLSLALKAAALLAGADWAGAWLHLQAIGAIALMILAVMTRATLGHTGRDLVAAPPVVVAYLLLPLAALARAFGPLLMPGTAAYGLAGGLWLLASPFVLGFESNHVATVNAVLVGAFVAILSAWALELDREVGKLWDRLIAGH